MNRPSFQFYPADWLGNSNLRRCTHTEKGVWIDVMCLLHDAAEYGMLRWPLKEIARAAGCQVSILNALVAKGVMKGSDSSNSVPFIYTPRSGRKDGEPVTLVPVQLGPIWYSSRMVRDEHVRLKRGEESRFVGGDGGTPKASSKAAPKPPLSDGSSSSSSSSSSSREKTMPSATPEQIQKTAPASPDHPSLVQPKKKSRSSGETTFTAWREQIKVAGEKAISDYQPVWTYAEKTGIPIEWVELAWGKLKERYTNDATYKEKRYQDWRRVFLNAVMENWYKLWFFKDGQFILSTSGQQAERATLEAA